MLYLSASLTLCQLALPCSLFTQGPLPHRRHDSTFKLLDSSFDVAILLCVCRLAPLIPPAPGHDNGKGERTVMAKYIHSCGASNRRLYVSGPGRSVLPVEESHAEEGRQVQAGRKMVPRRDNVFIEVLSRLLAWARRRCCPAISRLSLDSF